MTDTRAHVPHCPYCLSPVRPAEHSVVCSACGIPHHRECWQANSRCTTYGCIGQPIRVPLEATAEALEDELGLELPPIELTREEVFAPSPPAPPRRWPSAPPWWRPNTITFAEDSRPNEAPEQQSVWTRNIFGSREVEDRWRGGALAVGLVVWLISVMVSATQHHTPPYPPPPPPPMIPASPRPKSPPPRLIPPQASRARLPNASWRYIKRRCYLRSSPDERAMVLAELSAGGMVELLRANLGWAHVRLEDGDTGYLPRDAMSTTRPPTRPESRQPRR